MIEDKLLKLGFTTTEAKVYLAVLKKGRSRAGEIILESKIPRSAVYTALEEFVKRELISETEVKGVRTFMANDPDNLVREMEEKKGFAQNVSDELKKLQEIPAREVAVYEGVEGIERAAEKSLQAPAGETIYFLGPSKFGLQADLEEFWQRFHQKRMKKGLKSKILYDQSTDKQILDNRNHLANSVARYLPFGTRMPIWFTMAGDNLSIVVPGEEPLLVFSIKSRAAADGLKKYFEYFWEHDFAITIGKERQAEEKNKRLGGAVFGE